jgi:plastocyanin
MSIHLTVKNLRRIARLDSLFVAGVLLLAIFAASCGHSENSEEPGDRPAAVNSAAKPVDPATAGTVTGTVQFDGALPQMKNVNMASVPSCARLHSSPQMAQDVVLGNNGTLQNVVVYLKGEFSQYAFPPATAPIQIDQSGCVYSPHVVALVTGEPLQITNSDATTHNVNAISTRRQGWNQTLAPGSAPIESSFAREEIPIAVKCNIHPWMKFYVAVLRHPYFQVTGNDGSFVLKNVPPGSYTLTAWHERYSSKERTVIVKPNSKQNISITFTERDRR